MRLFRKFQWQLSLSYTLVAVGSLLVVEMILIGGMLLLLNSETIPNVLVGSLREQFSASLRPFLDRPTPDTAGLTRFLNAYGGIKPVEPGATPAPDTQIWSAQESSQNLVVIDPQGSVLWSQYGTPGAAAGKPFDPRTIPGVEKVLPSALANAREPSSLYTRTGHLLVMAVPIEDESREKVLAVLVFVLEMPSLFNPQFMSQFLPTILISVAAFTLFAGLVGSVFGYLTARGLTARLGRVSRAADAWSRGDFSTNIPDGAGDELGELARRLNAMAEQLRTLLNTRQDLAALEERNRIARELHDSVKQQVFAASMQLGAARALIEDPDGPAAKRLEEAERLTHQAQSELNALIHQLRPVALEGKGLERALRDLAGEWSRQTGIDARFEQPEGHNTARPALPHEQALYRIAQEALANVARHSMARSVRIRYTCSGENARLIIEDDGQGFDPGSAPQGVGLQSMRERVEALGGRMEVHTAPGQGTRLTVEILPEMRREP